MFEQITTSSAAKRSPWTFAASLSTQSILIAAALAIPLMNVAKIDTHPSIPLWLPRPVGEVPVQRTAAKGSPSSAVSTAPVYKVFHAPTSIPQHIATGPDPVGEFPLLAGPPGIAGEQGGVITGLPDLSARPLAVVPPAPKTQAAPPPAASHEPLRVNSGIQDAKLIFGPKPTYPPLARQARISGTVRLAARISTDGHIRDLTLISGHPMLTAAAIEAVRQWVYKPTLLNKEPVEVVTEIQVNFILN